MMSWGKCKAICLGINKRFIDVGNVVDMVEVDNG
jgi:hypothetical protein